MLDVEHVYSRTICLSEHAEALIEHVKMIANMTLMKNSLKKQTSTQTNKQTNKKRATSSLTTGPAYLQHK